MTSTHAVTSHRGRRRGLAVAATALAALVALTGCGASSDAAAGSRIDLVGFSILEGVNKTTIADFEKTPAGADADFTTSYGASGDQSRAVVGGQPADVVHFSLETDMTRLVDAGLVAEDWDAGPTGGIGSQSVVVIAVRKGNPKNIQGWDDLVKPGIEVVTPNPGSSGSARWNILAAWGHVIADGGTEDDAKAFLTAFFGNVVALPGSGREATTAFTSGVGDALISYENEAITARANGADLDYVVPDDTLLIQNPIAATTDASPAAKDFVSYLIGKEGQLDYARAGFRPLVDVGDVETPGANDPADPYPTPGRLLTVADDFGGWADAATKFFDEDDGIITKIQAETGKQ